MQNVPEYYENDFLKTKIKYLDIVGLKVMIYYSNVYSENPFLK